MKATFENSVNVLVKAYFDGYLNAMQCSCCAVGNLVANSLGYKFNSDGEWIGVEPKWKRAVGWNGVSPFRYQTEKETKQEIDSTGYSLDEIFKIERAFMENAKTVSNPDRDNFDGLMAVVDLLAQIHNVDLSVKENAKLLFVKL